MIKDGRTAVFDSESQAGVSVEIPVELLVLCARDARTLSEFRRMIVETSSMHQGGISAVLDVKEFRAPISRGITRDQVVDALEKCQGVVYRAAKMLGVRDSSVHYHIRQFNLQTLVNDLRAQKRSAQVAKAFAAIA